MCAKLKKLGLSAFVSCWPHVKKNPFRSICRSATHILGMPHGSSSLSCSCHTQGGNLNAAIWVCNVKSMCLTCSMSLANLSTSQSLIKTVTACKHGRMRQHCNNIPQCGSPHHSLLISRLHCLPSPSPIPPLRNTSRGPQLLI